MSTIEPLSSHATTDEVPARKAAGAKAFGRFRRDRRGAAAIEFVFLAFPFLLLVFATIETSIVFLAELTLDQAVDQVGRTLRTGEIQKAATTKEQFKQKICDKVGFILKCGDLMIDVATYPSFDSIPAPYSNGILNTAGFAYDPGGSETITAVRVFYKWPIYTDMMRSYLSENANGTHLLYAISAFKTEPF